MECFRVHIDKVYTFGMEAPAACDTAGAHGGNLRQLLSTYCPAESVGGNSKGHTGRGRGRSVMGVAAGFSAGSCFALAGLAGPAAASGPFDAGAGALPADHASVSRCSSSSRFLSIGVKPLCQPCAQPSRGS